MLKYPKAKLVRNETYSNNILDPDISILNLEQCDELLKKLLTIKDININAKQKKALQKYLNQDKGKITAKSGFLGLVSRQHSLIEDYNKMEKKNWEELSYKEQLNEKNIFEKRMNDLAALHRFYLILSKIDDNLDSHNKEILFEKIACIINTEKSESYFSDFFELYVFFILRNKGLKIDFLTPQKENKKNLKTCDYIFDNIITADCKCLIGDITIDSIMQYSQDVISQITSTKGYKNIELGGAIFCLKDSNHEYLKPLENITNGDELINFAEETNYKIIDSLKNIKNNNELKFLLLYYIPEFKISLDGMSKLKPDSIMTRNEFFFMIVTKYSTDNDFQKIKLAFEKCVPSFIRFNE